MDPFTMASLLLGDVQLTPGQLAQLRALNTKYFTELYAHQRRAADERGPGAAAVKPLADRPSAAPEADLAELHAMIARDIRDMLTEEQRAVLDRNLPRLREREVERPADVTREGMPPSAPAPGPEARRPEPDAPPPGPGPNAR
jgi:hypothetical protein